MEYLLCKHACMNVQKQVRALTRFHSCCTLSDVSRSHFTRRTMALQAHTGHLQYFFYSVYSVRLSAGCQCAQLPGKQPHLLPIIKYAFKMSLAPERAKAEATNRFTLVVQLTLAWTPTLPLPPFPFSYFLSRLFSGPCSVPSLTLAFF